MGYVYSVLIIIGIYLILAQSFNLIFGLGKLLNLAHLSVYALGAYATAILSTKFGCGFFLCLAASVFLGAVLSFIVGAISFRLAEEYFIVGTLAFGSLISSLIINWQTVTNGVLGIAGIPRPEIFGMSLESTPRLFGLVLICAVVSQLFFYFVFKSSFARSLRAQGEAEHVMLTLARNTRRLRSLTFFISSIFASLAGCLFAYYLNLVEPGSFALTEMVFVFTVVVAGRPGSFWGVTAANTVLCLIPEVLKFVAISPEFLGPLRQLINAGILFGIVYFNRYRLFPVQRRI